MMNLLERDEILGELRRLRQGAADGNGCLVLLGGEAGIGKTALLRRFGDDSRAGARLLLGHCDPLSTPRPLGPLFDIADEELANLLAEHATRDAIFRAVLAGFSNRRLPTVVVIEDAHWADEATLDLLRYLGRRVETTNAMVVVSYRDDEVGPRHPLRRVMGDLATAASVHRLTLAPLTIDAVRTLAASSGLDPKELCDRTQGNPFFVTEILAAGGEIPGTVRDAVLARASRLRPSAWHFLTAAAVVGSPIDLRLVDQILTRTPGDLENCLESGMLVMDGSTVTFRHELTREAILTAISSPQRTAFHRAVLGALEEDPPHLHDPARLAHHAEEAGDTKGVLRHAPEAAHRASLLRAHREAADQLARALRFAGELPPEERARLLEARSYACYLTAQIDSAIADRTAALDIWLTLGDQRKSGENRGHLATLYWAQARIMDAEREAEVAVTLLEQLPAGEELAMAYGTLARLSGTNLDSDDAISFGKKSIMLAECYRANETLADALMTVGEAQLSRGWVEEGQHNIETGMMLANDTGLDEVSARGYISLGYGFAERGQYATASAYYKRGIRFCLERDLDLPLHHLTTLLARCGCLLGQWDDALDLATSVMNARDAAPASRFEAQLVSGRVMVRRGNVAGEALLADAWDLAMQSGCVVYLGPIQAARAEAAFLTGRLDDALATAHAAFDLAVERGYAWCADELAYWCWKSGDASVAAARIDSPFARQIAGDWACAAAAWDELGCPYEAARARAESNDEASLRAALSAFDELGAIPAAAFVRNRLRELGARRVPRGPRPSTRANPAGMTAREVDVLKILAEGRSNQDIAERLYLSPRTVENHVAAILAKLGAATRIDAKEAARQHGIIF